MRIVLSLLLLAAGTTSSIAQQTKTVTILPVAPRAELGLFAQTSFSSSAQDNINFGGIQYKRWINEHRGIKVIAAYGAYENAGNTFFIGSVPNMLPGQGGDTSIEKNINTRINLGMLGAGVEMQRKFYKKVYLFAGLELRGGYGSGSHDTITVKRYARNNNDRSYTQMIDGSADADMLYFAVMPSVGAKLQFNRICFGAELSGIDATFKSISVGKSFRTGEFDMYAGRINHRFFINYRL